MKNKTKKALCAASILGVVAISGIFAYLTDFETKENKFTIGNVDIELLEPAWEIIYDDPATEDVDEDNGVDKDKNGIPDFAENIVPGQVIAKDPQIKNIGANDAYVFMLVDIPSKDIDEYDEDGNIVNSADDGLVSFLYETMYDNNYGYNEDDWVKIGWKSMYNENDRRICRSVYAYKLPLLADPSGDGAEANPLFDHVQVANVALDQIDTEEDDIGIKITAIAIQADDLPDEISGAIEDSDTDEEYIEAMKDLFDVYQAGLEDKLYVEDRIV